MKHLFFLLIFLALWATPAHADNPLQGHWIDQRTLVVTWEAPGWHCLYLAGGPYLEVLIEHSCRDASGGAVLTTGGVDVQYEPSRRTTIILRGINTPDITLPIPPAPLGYHRYLPLMLR